MKLHNLKIDSVYYSEIEYGIKTFELRKNDRDYEVFDLIHFVDTNGQDFKANSNNVYQIVYILRDAEKYGLDKDYCVLGIKRLQGN